jgi:hypothetical protein
MDTTNAFLRIWAAFDTGELLSACAWCGRVRIDQAWLRPSTAVLAAIDQRYTFSHSICDLCAAAYAPALDCRRAEAQLADSARLIS